MYRVRNWLPRLNALIKEVKWRPHVWGEWDCALWAGKAIEVQTGVDVTVPFHGRYNDELSCMIALRELGHGSLLGLCRNIAGDPLPVHMAWRGDILYRDDHTLGVAYGPHGLFVGHIGEQAGLIAEPINLSKYVFRIPLPPATPDRLPASAIRAEESNG